MVFVDSNLILDVITADPRWQRWREEQLCRWLDRGALLSTGRFQADRAG